jgi:hypothetical protein
MRLELPSVEGAADGAESEAYHSADSCICTPDRILHCIELSFTAPLLDGTPSWRRVIVIPAERLL